MNTPEPDIPVTLTITEAGPNWVAVLSFNNDPPHVAYILSFHLTLEAAIDACYAYLYTSHANNTYPRPKNAYRLTDPPRKAPHSNVVLSDEAWAYFNNQTKLFRYNGRASYLGVGVYLLALLDANPLPSDWSDNRSIVEPELPDYNDARVDDNKLPVWNDDEFNTNRDWRGRRRRVRTLPTQKLDLILSRLEPIAVAHGVTPVQDMRDLLTKRRWASAALEAIGLRYLLPHNSPNVNPMPAKRDRSRHKNTAKSDAKFAVY